MKDLIKALRESHDFQVIMEQEMWKHRPVIPEYVPQDTRDKTENLVERIKFESAKRLGFDTLYRALLGRLKE